MKEECPLSLKKGADLVVGDIIVGLQHFPERAEHRAITMWCVMSAEPGDDCSRGRDITMQLLWKDFEGSDWEGRVETMRLSNKADYNILVPEPAAIFSHRTVRRGAPK